MRKHAVLDSKSAGILLIQDVLRHYVIKEDSFFQRKLCNMEIKKYYVWPRLVFLKFMQKWSVLRTKRRTTGETPKSALVEVAAPSTGKKEYETLCSTSDVELYELQKLQ